MSVHGEPGGELSASRPFGDLSEGIAGLPEWRPGEALLRTRASAMPCNVKEPPTSANPRATAGIWSRAWKPEAADYLFFFGFFCSFFIDVPLPIEPSLRS